MWAKSVSMPQRQKRSCKADGSNAVNSAQRQGFDGNPKPLAGEMGDKVLHLRDAAEPGCSYEWGPTLESAFANTALALYNYMTPLCELTCKEQHQRTVTASAHDMHTLLFSFLDELLFIFSTEFLVFKEIVVTKLDRQDWTIEAHGRGDKFDRSRHSCGTEIKAITYSAMQIKDASPDKDAEIFVIVDI